MFKRANVIVLPEHEMPTGGYSVRGWDLAASESSRASWTAGVRMRRTRDGRVVIENCVRFRGGPGEVDRRMRTVADADGLGVQQDVPQDPGQAGLAQKAHIARNLEGLSVTFSRETGSKEVRASPLASQSEAGNLYMVEAPWNEVMLAEMDTFNHGAYSDQVDAMSRAYANLLRGSSGPSAGGGAIAVPLEED